MIPRGSIVIINTDFFGAVGRLGFVVRELDNSCWVCSIENYDARVMDDFSDNGMRLVGNDELTLVCSGENREDLKDGV